MVRPRSYCPACEHPIAWYDNVPLLSFALLRGRCRHCNAAISARYPVVELLTGVLFFVFVWRLGPSLAAAEVLPLERAACGVDVRGPGGAHPARRIHPGRHGGGAGAGLVRAGQTVYRRTAALGHRLAHRTRTGLRMAEALLGAIVPGFCLWFGRLDLFQAAPPRRAGPGRCETGGHGGRVPGIERRAVYADRRIAGRIADRLRLHPVHAPGPATYELPFGTFLGLAGIAVALWDQAHSSPTASRCAR